MRWRMARRSYDVESQEQWIMDLNVRLHCIMALEGTVTVCVCDPDYGALC